MSKVKVAVKKSILKVKTPIKTQQSETQVKERVNKALASVHASMAMEGLKPSKVTVALGRQYLEGKISGQEAISKVKARHLASVRPLQ
jgi:uncharacterized protein (DUF342 family)